MATPVYNQINEKLDYSSIDINSPIKNTNILSGPNWLPNLTSNLNGYKKTKNNNINFKCLDLLGKYHKGSLLKQFHALTFYFRDTNQKNSSAIITSMLPESFTYSIGGEYINPLRLSGGDVVNAMLQQITKGNLTTYNTIDSAYIWKSPKRMDLIFKIPVFDDSDDQSNINYQEAIQIFGDAILPNIDKNGAYESIPGPNITTVLNYRSTEGKTVKYSQSALALNTTVANKSIGVMGGELTHWDRISVQVGGLLLLDWCVIRDLKVTFPNTKTMVLHDFRSVNKETKKITNESLKLGN